MEDDYLLDLFERAAGDEPSAPQALAALRPRIRRAQRRRAALRGGAGLVVLVVIGGLISSTTTHQSRDVRVGGSGTTAAVESTTTTYAAPTSLAPHQAVVPQGAPEASPTTTIARPGSGGSGGGPAGPQSPAATPAPHAATNVVGSSKGAGTGQASGAGAISSATSVVSSSSVGGAPQVTSFDAQGGTVEVNYTESSMSLGVVSPSPGWSIANTQSDGESIQVTFAQQSGGNPVDVDVHLDGGKPVADNAPPASADVSTPAGG